MNFASRCTINTNTFPKGKQFYSFDPCILFCVLLLTFHCMYDIILCLYSRSIFTQTHGPAQLYKRPESKRLQGIAVIY